MYRMKKWIWSLVLMLAVLDMSAQKWLFPGQKPTDFVLKPKLDGSEELYSQRDITGVKNQRFLVSQIMDLAKLNYPKDSIFTKQDSICIKSGTTTQCISITQFNSVDSMRISNDTLYYRKSSQWLALKLPASGGGDPQNLQQTLEIGNSSNNLGLYITDAPGIVLATDSLSFPNIPDYMGSDTMVFTQGLVKSTNPNYGWDIAMGSIAPGMTIGRVLDTIGFAEYAKLKDSSYVAVDSTTMNSTTNPGADIQLTQFQIDLNIPEGYYADTLYLLLTGYYNESPEENPWLGMISSGSTMFDILSEDGAQITAPLKDPHFGDTLILPFIIPPGFSNSSITFNLVWTTEGAGQNYELQFDQLLVGGPIKPIPPANLVWDKGLIKKQTIIPTPPLVVENFANADLTFSDNRYHNGSGYSLNLNSFSDAIFSNIQNYFTVNTAPYAGNIATFNISGESLGYYMSNSMTGFNHQDYSTPNNYSKTLRNNLLGYYQNITYNPYRGSGNEHFYAYSSNDNTGDKEFLFTKDTTVGMLTGNYYDLRGIVITPNKLNIKTKNVANASAQVGQVLTLKDTYTGECEWEDVPGGGGEGINLYNSDDTLTGDRLLEGGGNSLTFTGLHNLQLNTDGGHLSVMAENGGLSLSSYGGNTNIHSDQEFIAFSSSDMGITTDATMDLTSQYDLNLTSNDGSITLYTPRQVNIIPEQYLNLSADSLNLNSAGKINISSDNILNIGSGDSIYIQADNLLKLATNDSMGLNAYNYLNLATNNVAITLGGDDTDLKINTYGSSDIVFNVKGFTDTSRIIIKSPIKRTPTKLLGMLNDTLVTYEALPKQAISLGTNSTISPLPVTDIFIIDKPTGSGTSTNNLPDINTVAHGTLFKIRRLDLNTNYTYNITAQASQSIRDTDNSLNSYISLTGTGTNYLEIMAIRSGVNGYAGSSMWVVLDKK